MKKYWKMIVAVVVAIGATVGVFYYYGKKSLTAGKADGQEV